MYSELNTYPFIDISIFYVCFLQLHNEDDATTETTTASSSTIGNTRTEASTSEAIHPPIPADQSPPPYVAEIGASNVEFSNEPPPQYTDVVKLPTYNESENIEADEPEPTTANRSVSCVPFFLFFEGMRGELLS